MGERAGRFAGFSVAVLDTEGVDLYFLLSSAAKQYSVPISLLLGMLKAESGLNPKAARYGEWPDLSFGLCQLTVATAKSYGLGDGSFAAANILAVRDALFQRDIAIDVGARHLAGCYERAADYPERELQALIAYNSGSPQPEENWYWQKYQSHIASYRYALSWAKEILEDQ